MSDPTLNKRVANPAMLHAPLVFPPPRTRVGSKRSVPHGTPRAFRAAVQATLDDCVSCTDVHKPVAHRESAVSCLLALLSWMRRVDPSWTGLSDDVRRRMALLPMDMHQPAALAVQAQLRAWVSACRRADAAADARDPLFAALVDA